MDKISGLPDELLIKILLLLPTKVAVSTSILSKRWECLWMWLPKLEFSRGNYKKPACESWEILRCFLDRNLLLHKAPVLESFSLSSMHSRFEPQGIKLWVEIALSRHLRELEIYYFANPKKADILPSSLYTSKSLVILNLSGPILLDVPLTVCLPSLKTLQLRMNKCLDGNTLRQLLSICPVLENLSVEICEIEEMGKITIIVPTLQSLSLHVPKEGYADEFVIDAPYLKYLKLDDHNDEYHHEEVHTCLIEKMPNLEEAYVNVTFPNIESLLRRITSVERLTICSEVVYGDGFVFNQLKHLKLCVGREYSLNLVIRLLKDSPNLRELDLYEMEDHGLDSLVSWNQPSSVPECMMSCLRTFSWSKYYGRPQERDLMLYILENTRCLESATVSANAKFVPRREMVMELLRSPPRIPPTCEFLFNNDFNR